MFTGSKGVLIADFRNRMLVPSTEGADMTYYTAPSAEEVAPPHGNFVSQWLNACKGDLKTSCDFDYAGRMIETLMLGLAAHRAGKELKLILQQDALPMMQLPMTICVRNTEMAGVING